MTQTPLRFRFLLILIAAVLMPGLYGSAGAQDAPPEWFRVGIGRIERPSDSHTARASAEFTNAIQQWVLDNTRLGIPVLFHEEALHGIQGPQGTSFPQSIALASTWNPDLIEEIFAAVAREVRARGARQVLPAVRNGCQRRRCAEPHGIL